MSFQKNITILHTAILLGFCGSATPATAGSAYPPTSQKFQDQMNQVWYEDGFVGGENMPLYSGEYVAVTCPKNPNGAILCRIGFSSNRIAGKYRMPYLQNFETGQVYNLDTETGFRDQGDGSFQYYGGCWVEGVRVYILARSKAEGVDTWTSTVMWGAGANTNGPGDTVDRTHLSGAVPNGFIGAHIGNISVEVKKVSGKTVCTPTLVIVQEVGFDYTIETSSTLDGTWATIATDTVTVPDSDATVAEVTINVIVATPTSAEVANFKEKQFFRIRTR